MERVTRVRGARRDENDDPVPPEPDKTLWASAVAPGASTNNKDRGRNGAKVAFTVYFFPAKDLREGDKLRVRGTLCDIVVQDWRSPYSGRRGLEVFCSSGKG
jgi:hypothetical protein